MSRRASWTVVLACSTIGYSLAVTFGDVWSLFLAAPMLVSGVASFAYLYAGGFGVDRPPDAPKRPDRE